MNTNDTNRQKAHAMIDHIFKDLLPAQGMVERSEQIKLSHRMLDTMLNGGIALCDAGTGIGKTLVSSSLIDRVASSINAKLVEVPVGFKWFVDPLFKGEVAFGGEESSGMSFLRKDGRVWTTDKDGLIPDLLAAEITAKTGKNPAQLHQDQVARFGESWYKRVDTPTTLEQKAKFAKLTGDDVAATQLAGEDITAKLTEAPGNHAKIGGLKVTTKDNWFAARPSGTENIYKVYAESFVSPEALDKVLDEAKLVVDKALGE